MSDPYETSRIRRGLSVLLDEAPLAPDFEDLTTTHAQSSKPRKPRPVAAILSAAAVMAVFVVGGLFLVESGGPTGPAAQPATDTTTTQSTTTTAAASTTPAEQAEDPAPIDVEAVATEFLESIPLPSGLNSTAIATSITAEDLDQIVQGEELPPGTTRTEIDRYMIGAHVAGAAVCAWIEEWLDATAVGDQERADEAVSALNTSRSWPVLAEMNPVGDYPEAVWKYADAVAAGGAIALGDFTTVADSYESAFGCNDR